VGLGEDPQVLAVRAPELFAVSCKPWILSGSVYSEGVPNDIADRGDISGCYSRGSQRLIIVWMDEWADCFGIRVYDGYE
jgi:hypothetical protein